MKRKIWIALVLVVAAGLICLGAALADSSGVCGDRATWTLTDEGKLTISGTGPTWDRPEDHDNTYYGLRSSITSIVIENGITGIGSYAFPFCRNLVSVTIPNSVTSIGRAAFGDCYALPSITIPGSVTSIGYGAISYCTSLTSITIQNGVTDIDNYAFSNCTSLTGVTIPSSVKRIGEYAFDDCSALARVTIPEGVETIGGGAFSYCTSLTSVTIPYSVKKIDFRAFERCSSLASVTVLHPSTTLGTYQNNVFYDCPSTLVLRGYAGSSTQACADDAGITFASLGDPSGLRTGSLTWSFATATGKLTIGGTGAMPDYESSGDAPWDAYWQSIKTASIRNGVTSIGNYAFSNCEVMTSISIPNSVTSIGRCAFFVCPSLTSIAIPDSVTSIGWSAFYRCSSLTDITIPASVASIGYRAFMNCNGLSSVTILNPDAVIGDGEYDVFEDCPSDLVLRGFTGSTAQTYADAWGLAFEALGPVPSFTLPANLTSIGNEAFRNIAAEAVLIPKTVTQITGNPFAGSSVRYIYGYSGSAAQTLAASYGYTFVSFGR